MNTKTLAVVLAVSLGLLAVRAHTETLPMAAAQDTLSSTIDPGPDMWNAGCSEDCYLDYSCFNHWEHLCTEWFNGYCHAWEDVEVTTCCYTCTCGGVSNRWCP